MFRKTPKDVSQLAHRLYELYSHDKVLQERTGNLTEKALTKTIDKLIRDPDTVKNIPPCLVQALRKFSQETVKEDTAKVAELLKAAKSTMRMIDQLSK